MARIPWRVLFLTVACVLAAVALTDERPSSRRDHSDDDDKDSGDARLLRQVHELEETLYSRLRAQSGPDADKSAGPDEGELLRGLQDLQFEKRGTALRGNPW